jgi:hypothetical protein
MQHLHTLIDLAAETCLTSSMVQQAIDTAQPYPQQGFIIAGQTPPNVVANAELRYFFWSKTDVNEDPIGEIYYYNGSSWTLFALIDGSLLANGSVTLNKLSLTGSSPYYIIQVNSLGTSLIWTSIVNAIQNNTLPANKMLGVADANNYVLTSISGATAFTLLSTFFSSTVPVNVIPINRLINGGANRFLRMKADASAPDWLTVDLADILAAGYIAGQSIRRNVGNTGWEGFTPNTGTSLTLTRLTNAGAFYTIPASAGVLTVAHGLGVTPVMSRVVARNITPVDGYVAGDEVNVSAIIADLDANDTEASGFTVCSDATNITVASTTYSQGLNYALKTGGLQTFDITKWKFNIYLLS